MMRDDLHLFAFKYFKRHKKRFHFINDVLFQGMFSMLFIIRDSIHIRKRLILEISIESKCKDH